MRNLKKEEVANTITHGIGVVLSLVGIVLLISLSPGQSLLPYLVFGISLLLLYAASTIYHALSKPGAKAALRKVDHMAIFILIAGTYTPYCLISLSGNIGLIMLIIVWTLAGAGVLLKLFFTGRFEKLSTGIYIAMGWLVIFCIKPIYAALPIDSFALLVAGGVAYTFGIIFYVSERIRYSHSIWHLFVLTGSTFHFFSVITITA